MKFVIFKYLSLHLILSYNLKRHYFRDNYSFLENIMFCRLFSSIFDNSVLILNDYNSVLILNNNNNKYFLYTDLLL